MKVAVLLSAGRSPISGRARRAPHDARALELALRLEAAELIALHVGNPEDPSLRAYLGMGIEEIEVVQAPAGRNVYPALVRWSQAHRPAVLLCGAAAIDADGGGLVPYLLAEDLNWPILSAACSLTVSDNEAIVEQALSDGRLQTLSARLPVVVTADTSAPRPRQSAYGRARRGRVRYIEDAGGLPEMVVPWQARPARRRGRGLKTVNPLASAEDRLRAITETSRRSNDPIAGLNADAAASRILQYLQREQIIQKTERE